MLVPKINSLVLICANVNYFCDLWIIFIFWRCL